MQIEKRQGPNDRIVERRSKKSMICLTFPNAGRIKPQLVWTTVVDVLAGWFVSPGHGAAR